MDMKKKQVYLKISVPDNNYCWNGINLCESFDNEGGCGICAINLGILKRDKDGNYLKPEKCVNLLNADCE